MQKLQSNRRLEKIILGLFVVGLVVLPFTAMAQIGGMVGTNLSIFSIGMGIANAVWVVFTVIAVIAFIVAGIMFLTAFGDATKISTARSALIWGVVGIIVAILAFGILTLVKTAIGA